jgi:hypothetical protein
MRTSRYIGRLVGPAWVLWILLGLILAPSASAFDPWPWASDEHQGDAPTSSFCLSQGGQSGWNAAAVDRVRDARTRWLDAIPDMTIALDSDLQGCPADTGFYTNDNPDIEMYWADCWPFKDGVQGLTWPRSGGTLPGTAWIRFFSKVSCAENAENIRWFFNDAIAIQSDQVDFTATVQHEMGHALGLHHPEGAEVINFEEPDFAKYKWWSYDGKAPFMVQAFNPKGSKDYRVFSQDDVSGGFWIKTKPPWPQNGTAQYLAYPNRPKYWGTYQGNLLDDIGYMVETIDSGASYSYMYMTTRFTTDGRPGRQHPTLKLEWRQNNGSGGDIRLRIRWNAVLSLAVCDQATNPSCATTPSYQWGRTCSDTHSGDIWEECQFEFDLGDFTVQDIRAYIYNYTGRRIHVRSIKLFDEGP